MVDYPDFLNVRKLALVLVLGPLGLLLLFTVLDVSMYQTKLVQISEQSCVGAKNYIGNKNQAHVDCP
ncbi:hypothetical protein NIES4071_35150 [Calothrix sp. NIES-4071]|nr:hypothetical protein NIES4071_35150 [Calothrix sp. NIES-4071]BAZ57834.1 hypothetical protein NIES4105_35080 [Calothrix sp. NIES-4105]